MNPGGDTHQRDWDEQRETISTYVDGALPPDERARFEQHLTSCPACQRELEAMRQVRALLRQMPQPALPRSFALPAASDVSASPAPAQTPAAPAPVPARTARVVPFTQRAGRIAQRVGTLAAAIGVVLLLGSALVGHQPMASNQSTSAPHLAAGGASGTTTTARQPSPGYFSAQQTPREGTSGAQATQSRPATAATATPTAGTPPSPTPTPVPMRQPAATGTTGSAAPSEGPPVVPLTGAGLLIGGAAIAVAGRVLSRRGRARR